MKIAVHPRIFQLFSGYSRCVVIAEGVETIAQKQLLESLFIDAIQGYLIARPSPLSQAITGLPESGSLPL